MPENDDHGNEAADDGRAWLLISVLFSSRPLTAPIAGRLQKAAFDLYASDESVLKVKGALMEGEVRNLRKELLLGTQPGHAFEAELETETGKLVVRYLLTRDGIELLAQSRPRTMMN